METTRRKWLAQASILFLGAGLASLKAKASPVIEPVYFLPEPDDGTVRISSNENPYGPSPMACAAMAESIKSSNRYQWQIVKELISAIAAKNNVAYEHVLIGAGSTEVIDAVIQLAAVQKGNFIIAEPTFSRWTDAAEKCGLKKIAIPLTTDKRHDLAVMLSAVTPDTRMIYVCNPNNPTGTICKHDALVAFVKEATKKTMVLVDEAYLDYTNEISLSSLVTENENLIVVKSFSKVYGLAGARVGYALAHARTIKRLGQLRSGANVGVSAVSMAGAIASLKDTDFLKASYFQNEQARSYTIQELERLRVPCIPSYTNFIYFSLQNYTNDFFALLKANNIEGTNIFEEKGKWSRITVGTMQEMKRFISAIE